MPTLYMHYKFGKDVLNKLNKNTQKEIKKNIEYYNMYNQGFDNLYYYIFKWSYYRKFGIKAHQIKIDEFFYNMIDYIKNNNLENNSQVTNMVYGLINHYTLDTILHPYINYQVNNLTIPHTKLEFMLDYNLYKKKWNKKIYKELIPKIKFNKDLLNFIDYIFETTHNEKNISKIFEKSHHYSYYLYTIFIYDKYGIKTFFYKLIDLFTPKNFLKFHENTFYIKNFNKQILNNHHKSWHHANNKNETYNYSLEELYNYALKISIKLNKITYKVLHNKTNILDLINLIKEINLKNIEAILKK